MKIISGAATAVAVFPGLIGPASATTVTFDDLTGYLVDEPYIEQGVTVTSLYPGEALASEFTPGTLHLDDAGTGLAAGAVFTAGGTFDVVGFSFISLGFNFFDPAPNVVDSILATGYRGGAQVVQNAITMSPVFGTVQDIVLGAAFMGLDAFSIEILYPNTEALCDAPCGHLDLDSVTFAGIGPVPVPLPASGALFGAALAGLALFRRRRT